MAAKTSWHRYEWQLRHCHPMYNVVCVEGGPEKSSKNNPDEGMNNTIMVMKERMKIREHNKPEIFELVR